MPVPSSHNSTLSDKEDAKKMAVDAMFKLEHGVEDKQKSKEVLPTLEQLKVLAFLDGNTKSADICTLTTA